MAASRSRGWEALAAAVLINLGAVIVLDECRLDPDEPDRPPVAAAPAAPAPDLGRLPAMPDGIAMVGLISRTPPALPLEAILGYGDSAAWNGTAPVRPRSADLPGDRAADRGGGAEGGTSTWTERRDRADDAALRSRLWNAPDGYRTPRTARGRRAASPEAITRDERDYGDRDALGATRALAGAPAASTGDRAGTGNVGIPAAATAATPDATAGLAGATTPARVDGTPRPTRETTFAETGAPAVDVTRRGALDDNRAVAAASDQQRLDAFDLTPPRSGGDHRGEGVAGATTAPGMLADGRGRGTAAARADAPAGPGDAATFATRQDPYFIELFRRLDRVVEYPSDLRVRLISGRVVAVFVLRPDGTLDDVSVHAGSGQRAFDASLTAALRRVGKLGPVPAALLEGRSNLRVMLPYTFRSPMIR